MERHYEVSVAIDINRTIALEVDDTKISIMAYDENSFFVADLSHAEIDQLIAALKDVQRRSIENGGAK